MINRTPILIAAFFVLSLGTLAASIFSYSGLINARNACRSSYQDYCRIKSIPEDISKVLRKSNSENRSLSGLDDINSFLESTAKRARIPVSKMTRVSPEKVRKLDDKVVTPVRVFLDDLEFSRLIVFADLLDKSRKHLEITGITIDNSGNKEGTDSWSLDIAMSFYSNQKSEMK